MPASVSCIPSIHVSSEEQAQYDGFASNLLRKTVAEFSDYRGLVDTRDWSFVRKKKQMSVYRSLHGTNDPRVTLMVGTGLIPGTLEDVMDGLYSDNTDDFRSVKTFTTKKFIDGAVLNVSEKRVPEAPFRFAGIKWSAAKAAWGMVKHRDILTYERMGTTMDAHGNELAFHVLQSIERPEWIVDAVKGVKRAQTATCYLYRRCNSRVQCFVWAEMYDLGSTSKRVAEYVIAGVLLNVVRSVECAEAKRYSKLMAAAKTKAWSSLNACTVCCKSPGMFERLAVCVGCLQHACKSCAQHHSIFEVDVRSGEPMQERFCKLCVSKVLSPAPPRSAVGGGSGGALKQHHANDTASDFAKTLREAETVTLGNITHQGEDERKPPSAADTSGSRQLTSYKFIDLADLRCYVVSSNEEGDCESSGYSSLSSPSSSLLRGP